MLNNFLKDPQTSEHTVEKMQVLIESSGARALVEAEIQRLGEQTYQALKELPVAEEVQSGLEQLVSGLLHRQH